MKKILLLLIILSYNCFIIKTEGMVNITAKFLQCTGSNRYNPNGFYSYKIENYPKDKKVLSIEPSSVRVCGRKLSIKINFENNEQFLGDEYLAINDVEDPESGLTTPLSNPIFIKLQKRQTQIIYPISAATGHCLQHSESWYNVCKLRKPTVLQEITVQLLEKITNCNGIHWIDLTRGQVIKMGTIYHRAYDELPSILLSYTSTIDDPCENQNCPVDPKNNWLLFPTSETEEIMAECIFVSQDDISLNGQHYDQLSITFDEVIHLGDRCQQTTRNCLAKQPLFLITSSNGMNKEYYLENVSFRPIEPLPSASEITKGDFIALEYIAPFESSIDIDVRADSNALIRKGIDLKIQSICTDSTTPDQTIIESIVINVGFLEGTFQPYLVNCTSALPDNIFIKGPKAHISPMHRHVFLITIEGSFVNDSMSCLVEIHNDSEVAIASKIAQFQSESRCICISEYDCSCFSPDTFLNNDSLWSIACKIFQSFYASDYFIIEPLNVFLTTFTILLLLGKVKILLGICSSTIRNFGSNYLRNCFKCCQAPCINPSTDSVTLQRAGTDILLNMFFFVLYPLAMIWNGLNSLWRSVNQSYHHNWSFRSRNKSNMVVKKRSSGNVRKDERFSLDDDDYEYVKNTLQTIKRSESKANSNRSNSR